jgi:hypothetical protein
LQPRFLTTLLYFYNYNIIRGKDNDFIYQNGFCASGNHVIIVMLNFKSLKD